MSDRTGNGQDSTLTCNKKNEDKTNMKNLKITGKILGN